MAKLTTDQRNQAIGMIRAGSSTRRVSEHFGCHTKTIQRLLARFRETGGVKDRPRSGRHPVTTDRQDRWILTTHLRNRLQTAVQTARDFPGPRRPHSDTIRNRLKKNGMLNRRPAIRPILTPRHRRARVEWCQRRQRLPLRWWNNVMFSDESRFNLSRSDGRARVYRRKGERYADCCVIERDRFGGGSVMVWAGICGCHRTNLIIVDGNLNAE